MTQDALRSSVVITMAGEGSRFRQAGYNVPKYEIVVRGRTLFAWSMESLRSFINEGCPFCFVARSNDNVGDFIAQECDTLGIRDFDVATIDKLTDGQATTALLAGPLLKSSSDPIAIYNIDTYVDPSGLNIRDIRGDGWVPCFPGEGDKWSFAAADDSGLISELREKRRISPNATIGLYWFDSFARYVHAYEKYYSNPERIEAKERYIAPLYNQLIEDGARIYLHHVPISLVYPLGTPEDVQAFSELTTGVQVPVKAA